MRSRIAPLIGIMLAFGAATTLAADTAPKTNVLLIVADDFQVQLGRYRSQAKTPNLDRLAARGVLFDHAYCQQTVCNPSRSSFLCGLRPDTIGLWSNSVHFRDRLPDVVTLPQAFKTAGYVTRNCGKIFHNWHTAVHGDRQSWSAPEFLHYESHGHDKPTVDGEPPPNTATLTPRKYTDVPLVERRDVPDEAYFDGRVANEAVRVLNEIKEQPFFLAVGFWKPHAPFNAPAKYWDLYDRSQLREPNSDWPEGAPTIAYHDGRELRGVPPDRITFNAEQIAEIRHGYYANISYMDAQVGKVLDALDKSGVADRTIIVFMADHGYHVGEHGLWGKTSCFELDARVPLIISTPNLTERGARAAGMVELLDLYPTLAELCGVPAPKNLEGKSLTPILADPDAVVKPMAFTQHPRPAYYDRTPKGVPDVMGYSVRTAHVRYTEWREWGTNEVLHQELYEHDTDPFETRNAFGSARDRLHLQQAQRLMRTLYPGTIDPPALDQEEERRLEQRYDIDEIRRDFPLKAGMTVDEVDGFCRRLGSLANPKHDDEPFSLGWEKRHLDQGNGWIYFWCSGDHALHCDLAVENGRVKNVWVMPGDLHSPSDIYFRLSGTGAHEVYGFRQENKSLIRADQDLAAIQKPELIDFLGLNGDKVTNRGLEQLNRFPNVRRLVVYNTAATDDGLVHLKQLSHLRDLKVSLREWSDTSMAQLAELTQLEVLEICPSAKQMEAHFKELLAKAQAPKDAATSTKVRDEEFTAAGLSKLRSLSHLRFLDLSFLPITDKALMPLTELAQLEELSLLSCDGITDAAIPTLAKMKRLKGIELSHTQVTESGANELRKQLPGCQVIFK